MKKETIALFGGLFFTYIIIKKLHWLGLTYLAIDYLILVLIILAYAYRKLHWLFETKGEKK